MASKRTKSVKRSTIKADSKRRDVFHDAIAIASTLAEGSKHSAAERIAKIASATRSVTYTFDDVPYLRDYAIAAADNLEEFADYVDDTPITEIVEQLSTFAKRQPMAALALTVAAGFMTTQLVRGWLPNGSSRTSSKRRVARTTGRSRGGNR